MHPRSYIHHQIDLEGTVFVDYNNLRGLSDSAYLKFYHSPNCWSYQFLTTLEVISSIKNQWFPLEYVCLKALS